MNKTAVDRGIEALVEVEVRMHGKSEQGTPGKLKDEPDLLKISKKKNGQT